MKKINELDFDNLIIISLTLIILICFTGMIISDYVNYLSGKETRDLVREAISKNMTVENINNSIK